MLLSYILKIKPSLQNMFFQNVQAHHDELFEVMVGCLKGLNVVSTKNMIQRCFILTSKDVASNESSTRVYESEESKEMNTEVDEKSDTFFTDINLESFRHELDRMIISKWMVVPSPFRIDLKSVHWVVSWHLEDLFRSCRNSDTITESQLKALEMWKGITPAHPATLRRSTHLQPFVQHFANQFVTYQKRSIMLFDQLLKLMTPHIKPNTQLPVGIFVFFMILHDPEYLFLIRRWKDVHLFGSEGMGLILKDKFWEGFPKLFTLLGDHDFYIYYQTRRQLVQQDAIVEYLMNAGPQQGNLKIVSTFSLRNFVMTLQFIAERTQLFKYVVFLIEKQRMN